MISNILQKTKIAHSTTKMHMLIIVFLIVVVFISLGCGKKNAGVIKIGATLPLSGDAAVWGNNTKDGIDLAVDQINASGGVLGRDIVILYEDTKALPAEGVNAYKKLTDVNKVDVIIDNSISSVTLAMAPLAQKDHVVVLATGATAPKISEAGEFIFRIWNSDAYEGEVSAEFAYDSLNLRNMAILYINNDYGVGLEDIFSSKFKALGGKIISSQSFDQNTSDVRTQLSKIRSNKPDGLYLVGYPKEIPIALRQAKELKIQIPMIGTVAMEDPQLVENSGNAAEGLMYPFPKDPLGENVRIFKTAFRDKYGKEPGITCDVGYDAVKMIARAIELTDGTSGDYIRNGLNMLKDYPGVSGVMTFDENGDVHKPMGIKEVVHSEFEWFHENQ